MKITKIILLTIIFSLFTFQASAISFSNLSSGGTGAINSGNGYFDDDAGNYGYTGNRNVFTLAEDTQIQLVEPISFVAGGTVYTPINSSYGTITDAVVHQGYLYFIDGGTLKKKGSRNDASSCESNDTSAGGCITVIATGVGESLRVYNSVLYYTVGTTQLRHLDATDNAVSDFTISSPPNGETLHKSFTITENNSVIQAYVFASQAASRDGVDVCTSTGCVDLYNSGITPTPANRFGTMYTTTNYVYILYWGSIGPTTEERLYRISNSTLQNIDYATDNSITQYRRAYVSEFSTIGLIAQSSTSYETYNSNEAGVGSLPTSPVALTYDLLELSSVQTSYYNNTNIQIVEALQLTFADNVLLWGDIDNDYRWRVDLIDPNNIPILSFTTGACNGLLTCSVTNVITFQPPDTNWTSGTYRAKMYEVNIAEGTSALLITSDTFTVLNTSSTGGSVAPGTGGGGEDGGLANTDTALRLINVFSMTSFWGFVIWLGIVGGIIKIMSSSQSGVNGTAVIVVAWLSAIFIALVGLFDPFKIYIIVMSTIIAAVLFKYGKAATTEG